MTSSERKRLESFVAASSKIGDDSKLSAAIRSALAENAALIHDLERARADLNASVAYAHPDWASACRERLTATFTDGVEALGDAATVEVNVGDLRAVLKAPSGAAS